MSVSTLKRALIITKHPKNHDQWFVQTGPKSVELVSGKLNTCDGVALFYNKTTTTFNVVATYALHTTKSTKNSVSTYAVIRRVVLNTKQPFTVKSIMPAIESECKKQGLKMPSNPHWPVCKLAADGVLVKLARGTYTVNHSLKTVEKLAANLA